MGWQTYSTLHPDAVQEMCGRKVRLVEELPRQLDGKILQVKKMAFLQNIERSELKKGETTFCFVYKKGRVLVKVSC